MDANGKNVKRLTNELGYDGGPFWSYDGKQIVYRAYHPQADKEKADYIALHTYINNLDNDFEKYRLRIKVGIYL